MTRPSEMDFQVCAKLCQRSETVRTCEGFGSFHFLGLVGPLGAPVPW